MIKNVIILVYYLILVVSCSEVIQSDNIPLDRLVEEKHILKKMRESIDLKLNLLENTQKYLKNEESINTLLQTNKVCDKESDCVSLFEIDSNNLSLKMTNYISGVIKENEKLLNIHLINFNKFEYSFATDRERDTKKIVNYDERFLLAFFTDQSIIITNNKGEILTVHSLNFSIKISQVDFSLFEEDSSIVFLSENFELSYITVDFKFEGKSYEELKVDIFIPLRKSTNIINKDTVSFLSQHKLHGHKYILVSFKSGTILVMNKDLEMKSSILLEKKVDNLFINNGVLGVINKNEVFFLNVLGGNSILLQCSSYYDIIEGIYDNNTNFLFLVDDHLNLLIYNIKLSISKQNTNECSSLFRFKLPAAINKENGNVVKMQLIKGILYLTVDNEYIMVINLNALNDIGLIANQFMIVKENKKVNTNMMISYLSYPQMNLAPNYILMSSADNKFVLIESKNIFRKHEVTATKDDYSNENLPFMNSNMMQSIFKFLNNNIFYFYALLIIIFSIVIVIYKKRKEENEKENIDEKDKHLPKGVNDKMLEGMWKSIQNLSKNTLNKIDQNKKATDPAEEKIEEEEIEEEIDEEIDEEFDEEDLEEEL